MAINTGIPYCMASVVLAYKDQPVSDLIFPDPSYPLASPRSSTDEPDQATAVVVPAPCGHHPQVSAMCVTLSLADEEKRSTEIDKHITDSDRQSDALVSNVFYSISFQLD